jgi:hypothetical protein
MSPTETDDDDEIDFDALRRAVKMARRIAPEYGKRFLLLKETDDDWLSEARQAAYACQCRRMRLKPWMEAPMHAYILEPDGTTTRDPVAGDWYDRLVAAGLSPLEPDPVAALRQAASRREPRR